jgi:nucleoid-associated protein YgaU
VSVRRLALTSAAMAAVALLLARLTPGVDVTIGALAHPQRTVDTAGADALLLAAAGVAAWAAWAWGALGLALTAASTAPGAVGGAAGLVVRLVLPAGARRGAAVALGLGLAVAAPVLHGSPVGGGRPVLAAAVTPAAVPDWPDAADAADAAVPDWPAGQTAGSHVVVRGDCLWDIAAARLRAAGSAATDAGIAVAAQAWWSANADVIGPDPALILPGQVLQPPDQP